VQNPDPGGTQSALVNLQVNGATQTSGCSGTSLGQGASLNGLVPFPSDNLWNKDISGSPVDANSSAVLNFIGTTIGLHADFGAGLYNDSSMGIAYTIVGGSQPLNPINYTAYGGESDAGPMPIPLTAPDRRLSQSGHGRSPRSRAR